MLTKLFGKSKGQGPKGSKLWKQLEKSGQAAESNNALDKAKEYYSNALKEIAKLAEKESRHERYFAFKISQIRFALERVESQLQN